MKERGKHNGAEAECLKVNIPREIIHKWLSYRDNPCQGDGNWLLMETNLTFSKIFHHYVRTKKTKRLHSSCCALAAGWYAIGPM